MHFGNFRKKSVKIGKDLKIKKVSDAFRKPRKASETFFEFPIFTDLSLHLTEISDSIIPRLR